MTGWTAASFNMEFYYGKKMENPIWKYYFVTIPLEISKFKSNNLITRNNIYINLLDFVWILKIKSKMWDFSETCLVYRPALGHLVPFNYTATINFFCRFCMLLVISSYLTQIEKKLLNKSKIIILPWFHITAHFTRLLCWQAQLDADVAVIPSGWHSYAFTT